MEIFGISTSALLGQLLLGLVNGSFYAMLSLGLAVIFGLLNVINFAHGALYMMGAFFAWMGLQYFGINYWLMLILAPLLVGIFGIVIEKTMLRWLYRLDHLYGLLLTFGIAIILEDLLKIVFGATPLRIEQPITGATEMFGLFFPNYRLFLMAVGALVIGAVWIVVFRTRLGAMVRAAAFDRDMAASLGVPVGVVYAGTFAFGVALAGLSGVLLAPIYSVFPTMGRDFVLIAFSVVIIGGMGSIRGAVIAGLLLTQVQSISSLFISPVWSDPLLFSIMVGVLMWRPHGLFGRLGHG